MILKNENDLSSWLSRVRDRYEDLINDIESGKITAGEAKRRGWENKVREFTPEGTMYFEINNENVHFKIDELMIVLKALKKATNK